MTAGAWNTFDRSVISASDALARLSQFDSLIDVRTEAVFAIVHLPGAISCPVLSNT
jgi:tRNA 2-selenouridine synthase